MILYGPCNQCCIDAQLQTKRICTPPIAAWLNLSIQLQMQVATNVCVETRGAFCILDVMHASNTR